jgi:hypothetical protein
MDSLITYALNKNPFLGSDPAVKQLVLADKPFRCIYAGAGNYDNEINNMLQLTKSASSDFNFMTNERYGKYTSGTGEETTEKNLASQWIFENVSVFTKDMMGRKTDTQNKHIADYWATALYKKYNYFCDEAGAVSCKYSGTGHSEYMATKQSTAYYMDIASRVTGGCSNAFVEYPVDDNGNPDASMVEGLKEECIVSGGQWNEPNSLKMVDMSQDIMSDLGASTGGICILKDSAGNNINESACGKYSNAEAVWEVIDEMAATPIKACLALNTTATACKSINQVYSAATGSLIPGSASWERKKEWQFVVNTAPPAMTLNPAEEFGWAKGICLGVQDMDESSKSKRAAAVKEMLQGKGLDDATIVSLTSAANQEEGIKGSYMDILSGCTNMNERLEKYYMTGGWDDYETDCHALTGKNKTECNARFIDEDCSKGNAKVQEACNARNAKKISIPTLPWEQIATKIDDATVAAIDKAAAEAINEDGTANPNADPLGVIKSRGVRYLTSFDDGLVTPAKSCLQYEEGLKASRNQWKARATEAIAENSRNLANIMKAEEMKQLAADLKVNMEVAMMTNEVFSQCLGQMRTCMTKDTLCGSDYKSCVGEDGLKKDRLLPAGLECYAPFKICMDTTSKTLNASNMSPALQEIVKGLQQDPNKVMDMAIDSIGENLADEFSLMMVKNCEEAGGFFYDGVCAIGITVATKKDEDINFAYQASIKVTTSGTRDQTVNSKSCKNKGKKNEKCTTTSEVVTVPFVSTATSNVSQSGARTDHSFYEGVGLVLPGGMLTNSSKEESGTATGDGLSGSVACGAVAEMNKDIDAMLGKDKTTTSGTVTTSTSTTIQNANISASCSASTKMKFIKQNVATGEVVFDESPQLTFTPAGPWEKIMSACGNKIKTRIVMPGGTAVSSTETDSMTILRDMFSTEDPTKNQITGLTSVTTYKTNPDTKAREVDTVKRRYYVESSNAGVFYKRQYMEKRSNSGAQPVLFAYNSTGNADWEFTGSESKGPAGEICTPRGWVLNSELADVVSRWQTQFSATPEQ